MRQRSFLLISSTILIMTSAIFAVPVRARDDSYSYARIVRLSLAEGDVQIVRPNASSKWEQAYANMPIQQGFAVGTNDGRAEIEFESGSEMWLDANSVVQFTQLALSDGGRITEITLSEGTATFDANLSAGDSFVVLTPKIRIKAPNKAEFRVDMFSNGGSVSVFKGSVSVTSPSGSQAVAKGETYALNTHAKDQVALKSNPSQDGWDHWVGSRLNATLYGDNRTQQNTNAPVSYGMADLSMYGNWNNFPGYGYGWQPFGMSAGWAPFMDGQWMMYPGLGWTWISAEPWGWMPYHFGGWQFSPDYGWMWMPGDYGAWNPAPVQWVGVGNRIGWRPVSPVRVNSRGGGTPTPVIVSTKTLGKAGRNRILAPAKFGNQLQMLAAAPLSNGKIATSEAMQRSVMQRSIMTAGRLKGVQPGQPTLMVPTASNLKALQASGAFGSRPVRPINSAPLRAMNSPMRPMVMNGVPPAPRLPSAPPSRAFVNGPTVFGQRNVGGRPSMATPSYSAPARAATMAPEMSRASSPAPARSAAAPARGGRGH